MSPHDRMVQLDQDGDSYVVSFTLPDGSQIIRAGVFKHCRDWLVVENPDDVDGETFYQFRHIASINIEIV